MRRRDFIAGLCALTAPPSQSRAQVARPRIAIMSIASAAFESANVQAFRDALGSALPKGQEPVIRASYAEGATARLDEFANEFVEWKADVILATTLGSALAVKNASSTMPIVCPTFGETFIPKLAASFSRPGGTLTGVAGNVEGLVAKRLHQLAEAVPNLTKIGVLLNPVGTSTQQNEAQFLAAGKSLNLPIQFEWISVAGEILPVFSKFNSGGCKAVVIEANGLFHSYQKEIIDAATNLKIAVAMPNRTGAVLGSLTSYGIDFLQSYRRCAFQIGKIVAGTPPGEIPIEVSTRMQFVVNLRTAEKLNISIPPSVIAYADEVIE